MAPIQNFVQNNTEFVTVWAGARIKKPLIYQGFFGTIPFHPFLDYAINNTLLTYESQKHSKDKKYVDTKNGKCIRKPFKEFYMGPCIWHESLENYFNKSFSNRNEFLNYNFSDFQMLQESRQRKTKKGWVKNFFISQGI